MKTKTQQQWVKDIMLSIITLMKSNSYNGDISNEGYKYTINAAVDNYSQTYWDENKKENISMFHKYNKFGTGIYRNILMSQEAYNYMLKFSQNESNDKKTKDESIKKMNKKLHGEHMTPQAYTRDKLKQLLSENLTDEELKDKIDYAFKDAKLCIITKDESNILDGKGEKYSEDEIDEFLKEYKDIHPDIPEYMESDFHGLKGVSKKSNGFGSIRLYVLMKNGVKFVNNKGEVKTFKECIEYLEDGNYSL